MAEFVEKRRFKRYSVYWPLQYKSEDGIPKESSISLNISEGGALVSVNRKLDLSAGLIVRMFLRNEEFFIRSRVVHIERFSERDPYNVGIEFLESTAGLVMKFYEELESIMFYQRHYSEEMDRTISLAEASMKLYRNSPAWMQ
ncbi:MAG: PilZ domain-containing protein [Candidatus Omnitrophota bacterium]|nr:PilZ domain-containing protein [Candidatus Omnitrophota bacterium]